MPMSWRDAHRYPNFDRTTNGYAWPSFQNEDPVFLQSIENRTYSSSKDDRSFLLDNRTPIDDRQPSSIPSIRTKETQASIITPKESRIAKMRSNGQSEYRNRSSEMPFSDNRPPAMDVMTPKDSVLPNRSTQAPRSNNRGSKMDAMTPKDLVLSNRSFKSSKTPSEPSNRDPSVSTFDNGTIKHSYKDGRVVVWFSNSDVKHVHPCGRVEYFYSDLNTWQVTHKSQIDVFYFDIGQVEAHKPNGDKDILFPDGTVRTVFSDG